MLSFVTRLLFVIAFIALARAGLPGWCDPHPPVPGGTIDPTGPVRDGGSVVITCQTGSNSAGSVTFRKFDFCIDGKWAPGITNCDNKRAWEFVNGVAQLPLLIATVVCASYCTQRGNNLLCTNVRETFQCILHLNVCSCKKYPPYCLDARAVSCFQPPERLSLDWCDCENHLSESIRLFFGCFNHCERSAT